MKLAQFTTGDFTARLGLLAGERLIDLAAARGGPDWLAESTDMLALIERGGRALAAIDDLRSRAGNLEDFAACAISPARPSSFPIAPISPILASPDRSAGRFPARFGAPIPRARSSRAGRCALAHFLLERSGESVQDSPVPCWKFGMSRAPNRMIHRPAHDSSKTSSRATYEARNSAESVQRILAASR